MKRVRFVLALFITLAVLCVTFDQPRPAFAAPPPVSGFQQFDLDGDGRPDQAVIECACVTDRDQILVFDSAGDMQPAPDWQIGTDINNDTWIFDVGHDGRANLIVVFQSNGGHQIATLYDDNNSDGAVAYRVIGRSVTIDEPGSWSLQVNAQPKWFMDDGAPNLNISVLLDAPFPRGFEYVDQELAQKYMPHDGVPDVAFELVDRDADGAAEYFVARLLSDIPPRFEVGKSRLWVNVGGQTSQQSPTAWFWPFLDLQPPGGEAAKSLRYFDLLPRITIDWPDAQIHGFVLPGYPTGSGYHVNNLQPIQPGQLNEADFEAPHAYYDLAANQDAYPELNIRLFRLLSAPWQEIRYSWNQFNLGALQWDYKLGLMGDHPIEEIVNLADFELRMVPYERLPYWVTERKWKLTTFVAREGEGRESAEGIYAWTPWAGADPVSPDNPSVEAYQAATAYLNGVSADPPYPFFSDVWAGYRGEYNLTRPLLPVLYFSPIDRRLHLKGAERGLLNLGDERYVVYENRDGDDYLEQWQLLEAGQVRRQLYFVRPYVIYADQDQVVLKETSAPLALWEVLPPRDHQDWLALGQQLAADRRDLAAEDFKALVTALDGPERHVAGATLRDFRSTTNGFRFVLILVEDWGATDATWPDLQGLPPGEYAVTYADDAFQITPLTPAQPVLVPGSLALSDSTPVALEPLRLQAVLHNQGLEDAALLPVQVLASGPDSPGEIIGQTEVSLPAGQSVPVRFNWVPAAPGEWQITLVWGQEEQPLLAPVSTGQSLRIQVAAQPALDWIKSWRLSNVQHPLLLLVFLTSLGLSAATLALAIIRGARGSQ